MPPGLRQVSSRDGSLPWRMTKRVYLPICPAAEMRICSTAPGRSVRWNFLKEIVTTPAWPLLFPEASTVTRCLAGHPRPLHVTVTRVPIGACTDSRVMRTLAGRCVPAIRTTGKGCISVGVVGMAVIVCVATLESPLASLTRSCTTCGPGVAKVVLSVACPAVNAPESKLQAKAVNGLLASVEVDTSETGSPTRGWDGND